MTCPSGQRQHISPLDRRTLIVTCLQGFGIIEYVLYCRYIASGGAIICNILIKFWILCYVCDGINSGCRWNHAAMVKVLHGCMHVTAQLQIDAIAVIIIICWRPWCRPLRGPVYSLWVGYTVPYIYVLRFWIMHMCVCTA
jgi:hypothetical protein